MVQRRLGWHTSVAALPDASETTAVCAPRAPLLGWDGLYSCSSEASLPELLSGCVAQLCCFDVFDSTCSTARMDGNRDIKTKNAGQLGQSTIWLPSSPMRGTDEKVVAGRCAARSRSSST